MRPSHNAYDLIARFEGFSANIYRCPAGYETIGYGHQIKQGENYAGGISRDSAYDLLRHDVRSAAYAVTRLLPIELTQPRYDALISFTFNLGAGVLQRSTLRQVLLRREFALAPNEFRRWVYAQGRKLKGLQLRREAEIALFISTNDLD